MAESSFTKSSLDYYCKTRPAIKKLKVTTGKSVSELDEEIMLVLQLLKEHITLNLNLMVLSGDFLVNASNCLDQLSKEIEKDTEILKRFIKRYRKKSLAPVLAYLYDYQTIVSYVRRHVKAVLDRFTLQAEKPYLVFDRLMKSPKEPYVDLTSIICRVCKIEYKLMYNDVQIQELIISKERLHDLGPTSKTMDLICKAAIEKISFLLEKLSLTQEKHSFSYDFNFELKRIGIKSPDSYDKNDFRALCQLFANPHLIDKSTIYDWQSSSLKKNVPMWQLVFLMRFYTKETQNIQQINNLFELACKHHKEYLESDEHSIINDYSDLSFMNYMYNSKFSYLCQNDTNMTFETMRDFLFEIEALQNRSFFRLYYPYQKAMEWTIKWIEKEIAADEYSKNIQEKFLFLQRVFKRYKEGIEWCKKNQPFLMQFRYNFSCIDEFDKNAKIRVFYPSSCCVPINYSDITEDIARFADTIHLLEYEIRHMPDRKALIEAKEKVANMERKNMEHMGLFVSVTTFLVGLLSVFIGNQGSVTLKDKLEYIIALGMIILLFVSVGYFAVGESSLKYRSIIFGIISIFCMAILTYLVCSYNIFCN